MKHVLVLVSTIAVSAQRAAFRAETEVVRIVATVTDAGGKPVLNLNKEDFAVAEDGAPQEIALFARDVDTPLSVSIVLDVSGSMGGEIATVREGLHEYLAGLDAGDEVGLITFSSRVRTLAGLNSSREQLLSSLANVEAGGGTALYGGMVEGLRMLSRGKHRKKILLLITDGNNTSEGVGHRTAAKAAQGSEALVYALGIGHSGRATWRGRLVAALNGPRMNLLRSFADPSGGRAELVDDVNGAGGDRVVRTIATFGDELRQQYTLGYYPPPGRADRRVRQVNVTVRDRSYVVRARKVYVRP